MSRSFELLFRTQLCDFVTPCSGYWLDGWERGCKLAGWQCVNKRFIYCKLILWYVTGLIKSLVTKQLCLFCTSLVPITLPLQSAKLKYLRFVLQHVRLVMYIYSRPG